MASGIEYHNFAPPWGSCLPCVDDDGSMNSNNNNNRNNNRNNRHNNEMKQTEELLASELNKLSVQERTEALDDLHCVGEELKESPDIIAESLQKFEELLQREQNPFYQMAVEQNRHYVEDPSFRLRFLRANLHNVPKAVRQMLNFLKHKANLFGENKIAREITLQDLNQQDLQVIVNGLWHVQEGTDQSGRIIIHTFGNEIGKCTPESMLRGGYYLFNEVLLRDPAVQMKGLVAFYHNVSRTPGDTKFGMPPIDFIFKVNDASTSFPVRYSAMHFCLQTNGGNLGLTNAFLKPLLNTLPQYARVRSRIHIGSSTELQYELRGHGIPLDTFPLDMNGNVRENISNIWFANYQLLQYNHHHHHYHQNNAILFGGGNNVVTSWNNTQQQQQQQDDFAPLDISTPAIWSIPIVIKNNNNNNNDTPLQDNNHEPFVMAPSQTPSEKDILLGRGKFAQSWSGNVQFREFVEKQFDDYNKLPTNQRNKRTIELTQELLDKGIRFFEQKKSGEWVEADCTEARQKVSQMFRSLRKKKSNAP